MISEVVEPEEEGEPGPRETAAGNEGGNETWILETDIVTTGAESANVNGREIGIVTATATAIGIGASPETSGRDGLPFPDQDHHREISESESEMGHSWSIPTGLGVALGTALPQQDPHHQILSLEQPLSRAAAARLAVGEAEAEEATGNLIGIEGGHHSMIAATATRAAAHRKGAGRGNETSEIAATAILIRRPDATLATSGNGAIVMVCQ